MFNKEKALKISTITLSAVAVMDLIRGFMHTFNIMWASAYFAHIDPIPDSLILMNSFGIANLLSGFTYLLVLKKAKYLSPYLLGLIPFAYVLGIISLKVNNITGEAAFNGKYMMFVYLGICALVSIYYFVSAKKE
jgi:hypothetical protein